MGREVMLSLRNPCPAKGNQQTAGVGPSPSRRPPQGGQQREARAAPADGERILAGLNRVPRPIIRHERCADLHQAVASLGCALICMSRRG